MKTLIIALTAITATIFVEGCANTDTAIADKQSVQQNSAEIRYYVMNKETKEFVGFAVGEDGKGFKLVDIEDGEAQGIEIVQTNKTRLNTNATTYTKDELVRMFKDFIEDKTFLTNMDEKFELTWIDKSGNMIAYKSKPFSQM